MASKFSKSLCFSIIVAVFNRSEVLQRCIDSVISQTYLNKELIIIDGGSTDGTVDILNFNKNKITYWESEPDRGIYHAFNKGLNHVTGDWIYFLGSDDYLWDSQTLSRIAKRLIATTDSDVRLVYGKVALVSSKGEVLVFINQPWKQVRRRFLQGCCICHQGVFHHRSFFEIHGQFDESLLVAGDYELLLRELKDKSPIFIPNIIVAAMQIGGVSSCSQYRLSALREYAEARRKNNVFVLFPFEWLWGYVKAIVWLILPRLIDDKNAKYIADSYRNLTGRASIWTKISSNQKN